MMVLAIEHEASSLQEIERLLKENGHEVLRARAGDTQALLDRHRPDLVLMDGPRLRSDLEQAYRAKVEFIGLVCHKLKNPLAALQAAADLLERRLCRGDSLNGSQPLLERIGRLSRRMAELLEEIQDLPRSSTNHFTLAP